MKNVKMTICLVAVVLFIAAGQVFGTLDLRDGGTWNIWWRINDDIRVDYQAPGKGTIFNLLEGGELWGSLHGYNDSHINIYSGETLNALLASDNSKVMMSGGEIGTAVSCQPYGSLFAGGQSEVTITGGKIRFDLCAGGQSEVTITGGKIVSGHLLATDNSKVMMSGGEIGYSIELGDQAILTIAGFNFAIDGNPFGYGEINSILGLDFSYEPHRRLTGTLANSNIINTDFRIGNSGSIVLIPEPTHILTIDVDPNDVGIDTITPSVGAHDYAGRVNINAQQFAKCPDVYVFDHWEGDVNDPNSANTTVFMDTDKTVTAVFVDGRQCGDECHPYPIGDLDKDCEVTFGDFALFASHWLDCTKPECD